jgi:hypothetical protein
VLGREAMSLHEMAQSRLTTTGCEHGGPRHELGFLRVDDERSAIAWVTQ